MRYLLLKDQQGELDLIDSFDDLGLAIMAYNTIGFDLAKKTNSSFVPYQYTDESSFSFVKTKSAFSRMKNGSRKAFAILELKAADAY